MSEQVVTVGAEVMIGANTVHPHLEGRRGAVVSITPFYPLSRGSRRRGEYKYVGGNPIVEVSRAGRFLIPADCLEVIG